MSIEYMVSELEHAVSNLDNAWLELANDEDGVVDEPATESVRQLAKRIAAIQESIADWLPEGDD